jgi:hypothetical protein
MMTINDGKHIWVDSAFAEKWKKLERDNATRGMYYKNAGRLVEDIFEEEQEKIVKELKNMMRKSINGKLTEFYEGE